MTVSAARRGSTIRSQALALLLALLLTVPAIAPLTYPGFFEAHSGFLPAFNAAHPQAAPTWGRLPDPVRGEGALPYLLIRPIYAVTGSGVAAIKWGYALAFLLAAAGVYAWTHRWLGRRSAVLAAILYTYLPWHLATVYVRGAYAEAWLWAFWPLALYAVDRLHRPRGRDAIAALVIGLLALAAAYWTQPGLAGVFLAILFPYSVVMALGRRAIVLRAGLSLGLLGFLLWWLVRQASPAPVVFADHYLYPFQLMSARWGTGVSVAGALDEMPFGLGLAGAGLALVTVALWLSGTGDPGDVSAVEADTTPPLQRALIFWCAALASTVLLVLPLAAPAWRVTGLDALLTYPWQVLALVALPLTFLSGAALRLDERLAAPAAWAGLIAFVLLASYFYLAPEFTQVGPGPEPVAFFQPIEAAAPQITLLEVDIQPPTALTPTLTLTLTWQAIAPVERDYTIFVHVLDAGEKVAQQDTRPCSGECPTNGWLPGEIVVDHHQVPVSPDAAGRIDRLALGLYLLETGDRAEVYGRDDGTVYLDVR